MLLSELRIIEEEGDITSHLKAIGDLWVKRMPSGLKDLAGGDAEIEAKLAKRAGSFNKYEITKRDGAPSLRIKSGSNAFTVRFEDPGEDSSDDEYLMYSGHGLMHGHTPYDITDHDAIADCLVDEMEAYVESYGGDNG